MRLSLIGPAFPFRGGIAQHTTRLYRALCQKHTVNFISFRRQYPRWLFPGKTDQDPSQPSEKIPTERLLDPINPRSWFDTADRVRGFGSSTLILPWWESFWALPFIVICRMVNRAGVRIIFVCHNLEPHEQRVGARFLTRLTLAYGDGLVVQSEADMSRARAMLPHMSIRYVPHPIYSASSEPDVPTDESNRVKQLLFFGFVRPYKGLMVLLEALPLVLAHQKVHLTIAGEFWESKEKYTAKISGLGIQDSITLIDRYMADEELPNLFGKMDLVVLPYVSVTTSAALGVAIGYNVPVVVSDIGDLGKIVRQNGIGAVVERGNYVMLAQAIVDALEPVKLDSFRQNARTLRKSANQSWEQLVTAIEELVAR